MTRNIRKARRAKLTTLLIVGEGADDQAFIKHMNRQFRDDAMGMAADIKKESGGSAGNIITNATRKYRSKAYDRRIFVLDSDLPPDQGSRNKAQENGYEIILWSPLCLEGALLDVLGEQVKTHETSQDLKSRLHPRLASHHTEVTAYSVLFPKVVLEGAINDSVVEVRDKLTGKRSKSS